MFTFKEPHFHGPCRPQNWSLPDSIIYYITMTPSNAKSYKKLLKSCKYFFSKNSVYVADDLSLHPNNMIRLDNCKWFDMADLTVKLWITNTINTFESGFSQLSPIIPKLYITDLKVLTLRDQRISYNDILFLSNVEKLEFCNVILKNEDGALLHQGSFVTLEKLVKALPKTKYITIVENHLSSKSMITSNTVKELLKLPHFSKISNFNLDDIPETFDIETFFAYIKKNKISKFDLRFADTVSDAYKTRLEAIVNEILQTENHDYKVPFIDFRDRNFFDYEKWSKYRLLLKKN